MVNPVEPGNPAPDFSLQNQDGEIVSLADFKGKPLVVYFYPKAMTPGCTVQACALRDARADYESAGVQVVGISPDPVKRLKKFAERDQLSFTLLSDEGHAVADAFGVWGLKKFMGREFDGIHRMTFIIDADGQVVHTMKKVKTKTHDQDVLSWIKDNL